MIDLENCDRFRTLVSTQKDPPMGVIQCLSWWLMVIHNMCVRLCICAILDCFNNYSLTIIKYIYRSERMYPIITNHLTCASLYGSDHKLSRFDCGRIFSLVWLRLDFWFSLYRPNSFDSTRIFQLMLALIWFDLISLLPRYVWPQMLCAMCVCFRPFWTLVALTRACALRPLVLSDSGYVWPLMLCPMCVCFRPFWTLVALTRACALRPLVLTDSGYMWPLMLCAMCVYVSGPSEPW